jgi:hypothetical protein
MAAQGRSLGFSLVFATQDILAMSGRTTAPKGREESPAVDLPRRNAILALNVSLRIREQPDQDADHTSDRSKYDHR